MELNVFEEQPINNSSLPAEWQSEAALDELAYFLQQNWEQRFAFYDDKRDSTGQQFIKFSGQRGIRTNNYIGTVVFKGQQLNIFPKMFRVRREENDVSKLSLRHLLKNIVQWLDYCTKIDYPYINITSELDSAEDLRELFISLYVRYVKSALDRGLCFRYEERTEDCNSIKGKFDFKDYFIKKYPNGRRDKFLCSYSEFEFDNTLNRIIKCTCKGLLKITKTNKKRITDILKRLSEVADVSCSPKDCDTIHLSKLHRHYGVILSMSKMFLLNKTSTYNVDDNQSFCFLFPAELLFEGFVGGFLKSILPADAKVTLQASDTKLIEDTIIEGTSYGSAYTLRNDMFVQMSGGKCFVLDTKYKQINKIENTKACADAVLRQISIDDLHQIREYAFKRGLREGYLLYPVYRFEDLNLPQKIQLKGYIIVDGVRYGIDVYVIRIPFVFEDNIEETKEMLSKTLLKIFA